MHVRLVIEWSGMPDRPRISAPLMETDLIDIANAVRRGEAAGRTARAEWRLEVDD